jgi:hypothetical protein
LNHLNGSEAEEIPTVYFGETILLQKQWRAVNEALLLMKIILSIAAALCLAPFAKASPYYVGPQACAECHKAESDVWSNTRHAISFRDLHKDPKTAAIIAAVGGVKNPRKNPLCVQCHYTLEQADDSSPAVAKSSVSCESCHGAASDWITIHNVYGDAGVTRETETPAHKTDRIDKSVQAGMLRPDSLYDLAANCLNCHSLARTGVDGATISKMLDAGHPIVADYELVEYSQGTVRHRFYPPDVSVNALMTDVELARFFIAGRAAMLVTDTAALGLSDSPAYKDALQKQIQGATDALNALKDIPEAAALVASPTDDNARKLVAAIADKDVSAGVKTLLPKPEDYK